MTSADSSLQDGAERTTTEPLLSPEIEAAIAKVDADCRRLLLGADRQTRPLPSVYEVLAATPEQGCDIPTALLHTMLGDGYILSHERRLIGILVARALPELASLRSRLEAAEARIAVLEVDAERGELR